MLGDIMKNRGMFYQNIEEGYNNPGMFIPPNGYNMNSQYQAYGPSIQANTLKQEQNDFEERINKLEKQIRNLDVRLQKLESINNNENDNFYTI